MGEKVCDVVQRGDRPIQATRATAQGECRVLLHHSDGTRRRAKQQVARDEGLVGEAPRHAFGEPADREDLHVARRLGVVGRRELDMRDAGIVGLGGAGAEIDEMVIHPGDRRTRAYRTPERVGEATGVARGLPFDLDRYIEDRVLCEIVGAPHVFAAADRALAVYGDDLRMVPREAVATRLIIARARRRRIDAKA